MMCKKNPLPKGVVSNPSGPSFCQLPLLIAKYELQFNVGVIYSRQIYTEIEVKCDILFVAGKRSNTSFFKPAFKHGCDHDPKKNQVIYTH